MSITVGRVTEFVLETKLIHIPVFDVSSHFKHVAEVPGYFTTSTFTKRLCSSTAVGRFAGSLAHASWMSSISSGAFTIFGMGDGRNGGLFALTAAYHIIMLPLNAEMSGGLP